jgi:RNA polymerase sigma-70 factor, ECF subfamily
MSGWAASRSGCNTMARPALGRMARPTTAGRPRLARLDLDRALVQAARADPARFDALYRKYLAPVYNYAVYELRDHHDAEDATERTFLAALAGLPGFQERADPSEGDEASTFKIWLFRIARNVVAERRRGQRRRPQSPLDLALVVPAPFDLEGEAITRDEAAAAWRAIDRLDDDRRRVVVLRFVHELSTAEIAAVLDRSEGAVRVLLHRALRSVAADLRRHDG